MIIIWITLIVVLLTISVLLICSEELRLLIYYTLRYGLADSELYLYDAPIKSKVIGSYKIKRDSKICFYVPNRRGCVEGKVVGFSKDGLIIIKGENHMVYKYSDWLINDDKLIYLRR